MARCFMQNDFTAVCAFTFAVTRNAMVTAECSHPLLRPRMALCAPHTKPIKNGRYLVIRQQAREIANQLFGCRIGLPTMLPYAVLHHFENRMITALPVQLESQLTRLHADDDFFKHRTQNPLPCRSRPR